MRSCCDLPCPTISLSSSIIYLQWKEPLRSSCTTCQNFSQTYPLFFSFSQFLTSSDDANLLIIWSVRRFELPEYDTHYCSRAMPCSLCFCQWELMKSLLRIRYTRTPCHSLDISSFQSTPAEENQHCQDGRRHGVYTVPSVYPNIISTLTLKAAFWLFCFVVVWK